MRRVVVSPGGARLPTVGAGPRAWPLRWADAVRAAAGSTTACPGEEKRRTILDESAADARAAWERSERAHGRPPNRR